jgi:transcriptional regulator with PAS, ATPase and Fis domain
VLIIGETGTGKELFAQSIHNSSLRANGPFVAINCAALPENLLESELFGYVEGSFTGARKGGKIGLFELAHKGSIFLDEIGDMPLNLQTRLLRVIQEKEVMRIGDDRVIPVDVRIIASTNKDLQMSVEKGEFRRDLYYRLNILTLKVPSLRKRKGDIANLVKHFINEYASEFKKNIRGLTEEAENYLHSLNYPGNVRELEGVIERAVALSKGEYISIKDLDLTNGFIEKPLQEVSEDKIMNLEELELKTIKEVLELTGNNISKASKILGIDRTSLWRKKKKL